MIGILLAGAAMVADSSRQASQPATQQTIRRLDAEWMETAKCGMRNGGYGFSWTETPNGLYIRAVAPGSHAQTAGLRGGQNVLKINGRSTIGMSRDQADALIHSRPVSGFELSIKGSSGVRLPPL